MKSEQNKYNGLWQKEWSVLHKIGPSVRSRNRILLKLIKKYIQRGTLLDSGCGDGTFFEILYREYREKLNYEGADISNIAIERVKELSFVKNTYIVDLEDKKSLPNKTYDAVISSEVLEHIKDWRLALENLLSSIKPKGYLFITVPHGMEYWSANDDFAKHYRRFEIGQIEDELKKQSYEVLESISWGFPTYWLYYTLLLNHTDPKENMSKKYYGLKRILSNILYIVFHIDDLFKNNFGRRLFIVAQRKIN